MAPGWGAATLTLLAAALCGCFIQLPRYPRVWPPLRSDAPCIDVTGSFENVGQRAGMDGVRRLTQILFRLDPGLDAAVRVDIEPAGAALQAVATMADGTVRRAILVDSGRCTQRQRFIKDPNDRGAVSDGGIAGVVHTSLELFRGDDGSLVVRGTERDLVIAYFIPAAVDVQQWLRFPQRRR
jgi:hypothetical protein